jgi:hypothetical protein
MISTIHDSTGVNTRRKTNVETKTPDAVVQYSKFTKGIDRAEQYLSYYSVLRKTVKRSKGVVLYQLKHCTLQCIFCVQDAQYKQKSKVKELPA